MNRSTHLAAAALVSIAATACSSSDDNSAELAAANERIEQLEQQLAGGDDTAPPSATTSAPSTTKQLVATTAQPATTKRTTTTVRRTTTTVAGIGTRDNPIPANLVPLGAGGDFDMLITGYETGVDVVAFNQFNIPPGAGEQYVRVRVKLTYTGEGTASPIFFGLNMVGQSGRTYQPATSIAGGSGGDPAELTDQPETFNGGSVEGWVYYLVDDADAVDPLVFPTGIEYTDVPGGVGFFAVPEPDA